ncbi:MAG: hypothetical protein KY453_00215 [Gemmatimonadetes bacterium]|nr:hypothetical protein [Gemmatimonadota bacterium]
MRRPLRTATLMLAGLAALSAPSAVAGQAGGDARAEGRLLRDAATREARGDLAGAEEVLRALLETSPASAGGLFALERVLRARERLADILPLADRYLEADPDAAGVRYLELRVLAELDSLAALESEAEGWMRERARAPEPYREVARIYAEVHGPERALAVLRRGVETVSDPAALAPELGDLLVRMGRPLEAVEAWSRAVGSAGGGGQQVLRRLRQLQGDRPALGEALVEMLAAEPTTTARKRVAVEAALDVGMASRARELAAEVASELRGESRRAFLGDVARWAESAGAAELGLWSYTRLREDVESGPEARALDLRIAETSLALGDTARAVAAHARLARALPVASPERRRALAALIRIEAATGEPGDIRSRLDVIQGEYPGAAETDALAAVVAGALQAAGREDDAVEVLADVQGPRSALERAYLYLERGDVELARQAFLDAVGGLAPADATEVIQLAGLLERLEPASARALAHAAVEAHRGKGAEAAASLAGAAGDLSAGDRPRVLAHAARLAEAAGDAAGAARLRALLVERHGEAPEAADAMLALARWHADTGGEGGLQEAARLLEALIVARPNSPIVPAARRELQRVRGRIP